jgi:hypothetical protein
VRKELPDSLSLSLAYKLFGLHDKMQYPLAAAQVHYKQAGPQYKMLIIIIIPARTLTQQQ